MSEYWKLKKKHDKKFETAVKNLQYSCDHEWGKWIIPWVDAKKEMRFCQICKLSEERPPSGGESKCPHVKK